MDAKQREKESDRERKGCSRLCVAKFIFGIRDRERGENVKMMRNREAITELHRNWFGGLSCTLPTYLPTYLPRYLLLFRDFSFGFGAAAADNKIILPTSENDGEGECFNSFSVKKIAQMKKTNFASPNCHHFFEEIKKFKFFICASLLEGHVVGSLV